MRERDVCFSRIPLRSWVREEELREHAAQCSCVDHASYCANVKFPIVSGQRWEQEPLFRKSLNVSMQRKITTGTGRKQNCTNKTLWGKCSVTMGKAVRARAERRERWM